MNETDSVVVRLDAAAHREVQALLPWHATQALDADDRRRVEAHVADCALCQADLAFERQLLAAQTAADDAPMAAAADAGLARLRSRLDAAPRPGARAALRAALQQLSDGWRGLGGFGRSVVAAQGALITALGLALVLNAGDDGRYRALGAAPTASPGNVLVMFRADATEAELRAALRERGARLVDGPTAGGAWVLAVPPAERRAAVDALRALPIVTLAQPLGPEAAR